MSIRDLCQPLSIGLAGLIAAACIGFSHGASARDADPTPLPPTQLIERLSLTLRQTAPSTAETTAFAKAVSAHPEQFQALYGKLVDGYLASSEFHATAALIHGLWWKVQPNESTSLAAYIVSHDRPYFEILSKDYVYLDGSRSPAYAQTGIATAEPLPTEAGDYHAVRLAPTETRFRSVLSNLDFLDTYPDTLTNRNRKRANQIFHTFLCETLAPTPLGDLKPEPPPPLPGMPPDPHGTDPSCAGCHYRLDPLARFFDHWQPPYTGATTTWYDPTPAAAGKLILVTANNGHTETAGTGESDLGKILAAEPRVHACAARQVWSYFMGPSIPLDDATSAQLVTALDKRQNFKDLVREVVNHPYFWSTQDPPPPRFADVKGAFQVCTTCHSVGGDISPQFDPTTYPFLTDAGANGKLLARIWGAINHATGFAPMPQAPIPALPSDTLSTIRSWIAAGANDDTLHPTLTDDQTQEVLDGN